ncbi:amino acid ABC transporter substrate-binding protein [Undibacterium sp. CCC2.1]|nr:amino acid ABC transporter substrate-binding protein [Undibacterium sp. CCC2.1]
MTRVIYPLGEVAHDTRYDDVIEILKTALKKTRSTHGDYLCIPSPVLMPKKRFLIELQQPTHSIDIAWNPTSEALESELTPIRIPLRKGLLGYRIALIRREDQVRFDQVNSIEDLKKFTLGQGNGWVDNAIYQAAGIMTLEAQYSQLIKMLAAQRFDFFPRGVSEVESEYQANHLAYPELAIENNLLLYYPFPDYFFFNHADTALKNRIESGLRIMQKDGSFDRIFNKYNLATIQKLKLKQRRLLRLNNPTLPKKTPLNETALWFVPDM